MITTMWTIYYTSDALRINIENTECRLFRKGIWLCLFPGFTNDTKTAFHSLKMFCLNFRSVANNSENNPLLYYGATVSQVTAFLLAIMFMLIYYRYCHPSTAGLSKISEVSDTPVFDPDKPGYSKSCSYHTHHPNSWSCTVV